MVIHSYEYERYCIAVLLRYPNLVAEIHVIIGESDFYSQLNRTVFGAIRDAYVNGEDINVFSIAAKITNLGITFSEIESNILEYLEELKLIPVNETGAMDFFKNLKLITVRREQCETAEKIIAAMHSKEAKDASLSEVISLSDKIYNEKISLYQSVGSSEFNNIFASMEQKVEERGNNPIEEFGFMGPFPRVNYLFGSLLRDGDITMVGARSGVGKSALAFFYNTWVAEKYGIPILHLDAGEMTEFQIQMRAVCMLTGGKVSVYLLETGKWRKNEEMVKLVREVWPRVKKLRCDYRNIGGMTGDEIVSIIRRYYFSKVGRGNKFIINYDYVKAIDDNPDSPEWSVMGHFIGKIKTLITTDVPAPLWSSLQLNKSGITRNRTANQVDDTENAFSIADRIYHQISAGFIVRPKLLEEMDNWPKHGNCIALPVKSRNLGEGAHEVLTPVRMPDGSLRPNFIHLNHKSFVFEEHGDLSQTAHLFGQIHPVPKPDKNDSLDSALTL